MFELVPVGKHTYYIEYPSKIGVYKPDDSPNVYLIDTGNDGRIAKRVLRIIEAQGWNLKGIFNTHCHADHVGGNAYLQNATDCDIYVPDVDCGAVNNPKLNPLMLYGAYPTKELTGKFYMAEKSNTKPLSGADLPEGLEWFTLYGHTMGMVGYKTSDGVVFVADSVSSAEVLKKYTVTYLIDVAGFLESLDWLDEMEGTLFIPSHCEPTENIKELTAVNREYVQKIIGEIITFCREPKLTDEVIKHFFDHNEIVFNMMQYALIGSTVKSYLSYLKSMGKITMVYIDNMLLWKSDF